MKLNYSHIDVKEGKQTPFDLCQALTSCLEDHKASDLVTLDLAGKSSIADFLIIGSATSSRHLKSLAEKVKEKAHELNIKTVRLEGLECSDWVLIDAGDIIVHLFKPEVRDFYGLEKMWSPK